MPLLNWIGKEKLLIEINTNRRNCGGFVVKNRKM